MIREEGSIKESTCAKKREEEEIQVRNASAEENENKKKPNAKCAVVSQAVDSKPEGSSHPLTLLHPNDLKSHELNTLLVIML
jgi:hypothetical protein